MAIPSGLPLLRFLVMLVAAWGLGGLLVALRFFRRVPRATWPESLQVFPESTDE